MRRDDEIEAAQQLGKAVDRLPRELRPGRDLWPEIAERLEERTAREPAAEWWRLAAAMLLVTGGLVAALLLRPGAPPAASVAARDSGEPAILAAAPLRERDGVLHAYNDLVTVVARQRARLDEAGGAALAGGLADLERAVAEIEVALADNPGDRRLRLALAAAYRREAYWTSRFGRV